jgi:NitT/TauT family transport system substrate-binding protein
MTRTRVIAVFVAALAALTVVHQRPWRDARPAAAADELAVGYLPVTCHLTCPVTDFATRTTTTSTRFVSQRFSDFPTVVEALKARRVDATFLLAPLAMVLREQGVPIHIVYLGHRDGSTMIVRKDSPARRLRDLAGKTFARPSRFSNQYLVITKLMADEGMQPADIQFVDMAPPDMPGALAAGAIDAYFVGEPFAAKAELAGTGRVLYYAKDIWPHFISCVLVVRDELIAGHPEVVRDLVRGIAESGEWAEHHRHAAAELVSRTEYYHQDRALLDFVLTQPPDRVSYRLLTPSDEDLRAIMHHAIKAGILRDEIALGDLVDLRFIPEHIRSIELDPKRP